ncbi:MAG TPA: menaquinone biosynthesis protein [Gemmatimonadales bacterium]|nr:menaquinone biosynthesis protein [Gemmatimonadales bacterium]
MRLGRIPWINALPVNAAMDRGLVEAPATVVSATAAELNDLLAAGELDVSVISAVEYARDASMYQLLPDLAISADGPVHSVMLFSMIPVDALDGRTVLRTASSRTSVLLLELLCRHVWQVSPRFATVRAEATDLDALPGLPHDAVLVIGDAALHLQRRGTYPVQVDLGAAWKEWTGLPFVFAVWAARRDVDRVEAMALHDRLLASRAWGIEHLDLLAAEAAAQTDMPVQMVREYLGQLDYRLTPAHQLGLTSFFRHLHHDGLAPDGTFSFLTAA